MFFRRVFAVEKGGKKLDGNGFNALCPECGTHMQMTSPANDWGCHNICPQCGHIESLEELEIKEKIEEKQQHLR